MILSIILAILATYRIALILATEEGAFGIFALIRERIDPKQATWLGRGLNCPYCIGFWIAFVMTILITHDSFSAESAMRIYLVNWFAIAGGQVLLQKWMEHE